MEKRRANRRAMLGMLIEFGRSINMGTFSMTHNWHGKGFPMLVKTKWDLVDVVHRIQSVILVQDYYKLTDCLSFRATVSRLLLRTERSLVYDKTESVGKAKR
jgi:hypothetical protein